MLEKSIDIIVFSRDYDFYSETKTLLKNIGINSIIYTDNSREASKLLDYKSSKVMIYDSLYGNYEMRDLIYSGICSCENAYCLYICERRDEELFGDNQPKILRLNRPYKAQDFYEAVLQSTYNLRCLKKPEGKPTYREIDRIPIAVTELMQKIGIPAHLKGFSYLRISIVDVVNEPDLLNLITKNLYVNLAGEFHTSAICVERAIRNAIDVAWERGNITLLNTHFGAFVKNRQRRPTNSEFIDVAANIIRAKFHLR